MIGLEGRIKVKKGLSRPNLTATRFIIVGMRLRGWPIRLRIDRSEAALKIRDLLVTVAVERVSVFRQEFAHGLNLEELASTVGI